MAVVGVGRGVAALPQLPAADLSLGAPLVVLVVAGVLGAGGLAARRHRDLATG